MADLSVFGQRIKQLRTELGLSQREFANKIGVTASALSSYEKGIKNPSINVAICIAEAFDISLDWLCGFVKDGSPNKKRHEVKGTLEYLLSFIDAGLLKLQVCTDQVSEWANQVTLSESLSELLMTHNQVSRLFYEKHITAEKYTAIIDSLIDSCTNDVLKDLSILDNLDKK